MRMAAVANPGIMTGPHTVTTALQPRSAGVTRALLREQYRFLAGTLPSPPARILDAGCGPGDLALALTRDGYDVTAIDIDPDAVAAARGQGVPAVQADIAAYEADPFDAVVFSLSLHHVARLADTVDRAADLLRPTGVLVLDEFAWERADGTTATWFCDTAELLGALSLLRTAHHDGGAFGRDPAAGDRDGCAWWTSHHRDHGMHTGERMQRAVAATFDVCAVDRVPYLHRYLGGWLAERPLASTAHTALRDLEQRRVDAGHLQPLGLRLVARHPSRPGR